MNSKAKRPFLVACDYGMGATWLLVDARHPQEIEVRYPELKVVEIRPDWLDDDRWRQLERDAHFDIDSEPTGFLAALIAERDPGSAT